MRAVRPLLIYLGCIFVGGALIAPWLYWLIQKIGGDAALIESLQRAPFHRYVSRCMQFVALLGLWPYLRSVRMQSWSGVGLISPKNQWGQIGRGSALAVATMLVVAVVAIAGGSRQWSSQGWHELPLALPSMLASAASVALLEELLFRGVLFGSLARHQDWKMAWVISSAVYAILHFFQRVKHSDAVVWTSGFAELRRMFGGFVDPQLLVPGFFSLTFAGMALTLAYWRTGNLYFSIGLHAGWIFWLKAFNLLTTSSSSPGRWLHVSKNLYDGWLGLALALAALGIIGWRQPPANSNTS